MAVLKAMRRLGTLLHNSRFPKKKVTISVVMGKRLHVEEEESQETGRFAVLQGFLKDRGLAPEKIQIVSYDLDASVIRTTKRWLQKKAANILRKALYQPNVVWCIIRQSRWTMYVHPDWKSGVEAGMSMWGQPNPNKLMKSIMGTVFARMSALLGGVLAVDWQSESLRYKVLTSDEQQKITAAEIEDMPQMSLEDTAASILSAHDGCLHVAGEYIMRLLYGTSWRRRGIAPLPEGTILKCVRIVFKDRGIVKGNARVSWRLVPGVDVAYHEVNFKDDWLPSVSLLVIGGIVDHRGACFTDRQFLTMFTAGAEKVFVQYVHEFFEAFDRALRAGVEATRQFLHLQSVEADEEPDVDTDLSKVQENATILTALRYMAKINIFRFPQLRSLIMNIALKGKTLRDKIAIGRVMVPSEFSDRGYVQPDPSGWLPSGYYSVKSLVMAKGEFHLYGREGRGAAVRSPHANPWEIVIGLFKDFAKVVPALFAAVGVLYVNFHDLKQVLGTLGGADLDDEAKVLFDKRFLAGIKDNFQIPNLEARADMALVAKYMDKPATKKCGGWKHVYESHLYCLEHGMLASIGTWAATVCRYLPAYRFLEAMYNDFQTMEANALAAKLGLPADKVNEVVSKFRAGKIGPTSEAMRLLIAAYPTKLRVATKNSHPSDGSAKRYRLARVGEVVLQSKVYDADSSPDCNILIDSLCHLKEIEGKYFVLLLKWFGEEYIDMGNGKHKGPHDIVGLFDAIAAELETARLSDMCCFMGKFSFTFDMADMFHGMYAMVTEGENGYVRAGVDVLQNVLLNGCWKKGQPYPVQGSLFQHIGGSRSALSELIPDVVTYKGKKVPMYKQDFRPQTHTTEATNRFFRTVWRPTIQRWLAEGRTYRMAAAMYTLAAKYVQDRPKGKYEWDMRPFNQQWLKPLFEAQLAKDRPTAQSNLRRFFGGNNVATMLKARILQNMQVMGKGGMPQLEGLPPEATPTREDLAEAWGMLVSYTAATLADARWIPAGGGQAVSTLQVIQHVTQHVELQIFTKDWIKDCLPAVVQSWAKEQPELCFYIALVTNYRLISDRLCWTDHIAAATARLVSGWYKDTPAGEIGEDYEEGPDLSEYVLDDGPDPDLTLSQDQADNYYVEE
jgi:hypothetical protein